MSEIGRQFQQKQERQTKTATVIGICSFFICLFTACAALALESSQPVYDRIPRDNAFVALGYHATSFLEFVVIAVGGLVGATLSVVGAVLAMIGLPKRQNASALALSGIGPLCLLLTWVYVYRISV